MSDKIRFIYVEYQIGLWGYFPKECYTYGRVPNTAIPDEWRRFYNQRRAYRWLRKRAFDLGWW